MIKSQITVICVAPKQLKDVATRFLTFETRRWVKMRLLPGLYPEPAGELTVLPQAWILGEGGMAEGNEKG